jgi:hypothetical protein
LRRAGRAASSFRGFLGCDVHIRKGGTTIEGKPGFADVWKRGYFGWEYKGKHKDLNVAYQQLLKYREDLDDPPLLVVCDLELFEVHTNFTGTAKQVYRFSLDDLLKNQATADCNVPPIEVLRALFNAPARLRPDRSSADVTEMAAREFATRAEAAGEAGVATVSAVLTVGSSGGGRVTANLLWTGQR